MRLLLTPRPGQLPLPFILSPASLCLPRPQPRPLSLLQTLHLQPSFLLPLNPGELAFLPRPCFPLQTPVPACSRRPPGPSPEALEGPFPPWMGLEVPGKGEAGVRLWPRRDPPGLLSLYGILEDLVSMGRGAQGILDN